MPKGLRSELFLPTIFLVGGLGGLQVREIVRILANDTNTLGG